MSRYIDIEPYEKDGWYLQKRYHNEHCEVVKTTPLKSVPTAEPNNGRWIKLFTDNYKCSECGAWWGSDYNDEIINDFNYCPNCGAKMDKTERMTREEAIRRLEEGAPFSELYDEVWENALIMAIEALKSEPVVRCKDCKHLNKEEMRCFNVEGLGYRNVVDDDFCSKGERKDGGENG